MSVNWSTVTVGGIYRVNDNCPVGSLVGMLVRVTDTSGAYIEASPVDNEHIRVLLMSIELDEVTV